MFSIIIPIYNAERTLQECLNSVKNQTYVDFEVIMVNDGSKDTSGQICKQYANNDPRFIYIEQENAGVSQARNAGIKIASKKWLAFLDADDKYNEEYLQNFYSLSNDYPNAKCLVCGFNVVDSNYKPREQHVFEEEKRVSVVPRCKIMHLHDKWMDSTLWNKVFLREIVVDNKLTMDPLLSLGEDLLFILSYLDACNDDIVILNTPLYQYMYATDGTLDSRYRSDLKEISEFLDDRLFEYLQIWNIDEEGLRKYYNSVIYRYEDIMRNTFRTENPMCMSEKFLYNKKILKSTKFKTALKHSDCFIHPLYRAAYSLKSYRLVYILNQIRERINHA